MVMGYIFVTTMNYAAEGQVRCESCRGSQEYEPSDTQQVVTRCSTVIILACIDFHVSSSINCILASVTKQGSA